MAERAGGIGGADLSSYQQPAGPGMMDIAGKAMGLAQQNTNLQQSQFNLQQGKLQAINAQLGAAMADPVVQAGGPNGMKQLMSYAGKLVAMGHVSAKDLSAAMTGINQNNIMQGLKQYQLSALQAQQQLDAVQGGLQTINTGREQQLIRTPAYGAAVPVQGGRFENQLTPGESVTPVAAPPDPNSGAPRQQPLAGFGVASGVLNPDRTMRSNPLMQQGAPPMPGNRLPVRQQPMQPNIAPAPTGNPAPQASAPSIPMPSQPERGVRQPGQVAQVNPYGAMPSGLPPGQVQAQTVDLEAGANQGVALQKAADTSPQRLAQLSNLEKNLAQFESGPQAERLRRIKGTVNQVGGIVGMRPFDAKSIAAQEGFVKEAAMLAQQQFAALGGTGTDQQLGSAMKSNPSELLSKEGNKNIIALLKGNEAAIVAKNDAWQRWKDKNGVGSSHSQFAADFNKSYSPRAFQFAFLPPEERSKMLASMSPSEMNALKAALQNAEERGWIRSDGKKSTNRAQ
jgi:hypothetical protein